MSGAAAGPVTTVFVGLGSNLGARRRQIEGATRALGETSHVRVVRVSPLIETEPVGGPADQPMFLNGVLEAETTLSARVFLARLQAIEARFGRDRTREVRNGPRTLDLDLLIYGDEEIRERDLIVPHPRLGERVFVLEPLAAIAPGRTLAGSGSTVSQRLDELRTAQAGEPG